MPLTKQARAKRRGTSGRFPDAGEPGSETWKDDPLPQGGTTWTAGSYDGATGVLYWGTGNPYPDTDGDHRGGDNLYTASDVALDAKTGALLWHFQFTPHDIHDWDANQPLVLVDAPFHGRERKLLLHANRNGFLYILDRTNGEFLQATPMVRKLTWASGIGADGRPLLLPNNETTLGGVQTCPAVRGATNWYSTAYNPATRLYYVMTVEDCSIYRKAHDGGYGPVDDSSRPGNEGPPRVLIGDGENRVGASRLQARRKKTIPAFSALLEDWCFLVRRAEDSPRWMPRPENTSGILKPVSRGRHRPLLIWWTDANTLPSRRDRISCRSPCPTSSAIQRIPPDPACNSPQVNVTVEN